MDHQQIIYQTEKGVAWVRLNRPEQLNAFTDRMGMEITDAMARACADDSVRVIVLTGEGRGFCAGADMNNLQALSAGERREREDFEPARPPNQVPEMDATYSWLTGLPKPVIAAVNGPCAGMAVAIALYADIRFAADSAVFTTAFAKRGLIAEWGIAWMLPRLIGMSNAADLMFSARRISGAEAERCGLVTRTFPDESFLDEVRAYAEELATSVSPRSLRIMKRQLYEAQSQNFQQAHRVAVEEMLDSLKSEDFKEGVAHFMERRAPGFTGN